MEKALPGKYQERTQPQDENEKKFCVGFADVSTCQRAVAFFGVFFIGFYIEIIVDDIDTACY